MNTGPQEKPPVQPFQMPIDSVRTITGRGVQLTGKVRQGAVKKGDPVTITGGAQPTTSVVTLVTISDRVVDHGRAGDTVGVLLPGIDVKTVARGYVLQAP